MAESIGRVEEPVRPSERRVDGIGPPAGRRPPQRSLELIEPYLFLDASSAAVFAGSIAGLSDIA